MESVEVQEIFSVLCVKIYGKKISIPKEFNKYKNLLEMCKEIEGINAYNKLILRLFNIVFLENGIPKKMIDSILLKCFKLCLEDKLDDNCLKSYVSSIEDKITYELKNEKIFSSKDIRLLSFLMTAKLDFKLFFDTFEDFYMEKCDKYIPTAQKERLFIDDENAFDMNLENFAMIYNILDIKSKEYFSFTLDKDWISTKTIPLDIAKEFKSKIPKRKINDLINFLSQNHQKSKIEIKNKISSDNKNVINNNQKSEGKKDEVNLYEEIANIKKMMKEKDLELLKMKNELNDFKTREIKANNTHRTKINSLNNEIKTLNNKIKGLEKERQKDANKMQIKFTQIKSSNSLLNTKIKELKNELETIKSRGVSKSLIDFITYSLGKENIDCNFSEKISFINNKLIKFIKDKNHPPIIDELKTLVEEIDSLKLNGDQFAHSELKLENLFKLVKGCDNAKNNIMDLNLSSLIEDFNKMYKLQILKKDCQDIYESILKAMESKKKLFCEKFCLR